jgi:hypothetical protein
MEKRQVTHSRKGDGREITKLRNLGAFWSPRLKQSESGPLVQRMVGIEISLAFIKGYADHLVQRLHYIRLLEEHDSQEPFVLEARGYRTGCQDQHTANAWVYKEWLGEPRVQADQHYPRNARSLAHLRNA